MGISAKKQNFMFGFQYVFLLASIRDDEMLYFVYLSPCLLLGLLII